MLGTHLGLLGDHSEFRGFPSVHVLAAASVGWETPKTVYRVHVDKGVTQPRAEPRHRHRGIYKEEDPVRD